VASYDLRPGNTAGLFSKEKISKEKSGEKRTSSAKINKWIKGMLLPGAWTGRQFLWNLGRVCNCRHNEYDNQAISSNKTNKTNCDCLVICTREAFLLAHWLNTSHSILTSSSASCCFSLANVCLVDSRHVAVSCSFSASVEIYRNKAHIEAALTKITKL